MLFRKTTDHIRDGISTAVTVPSRTAVTISGFALVIGVAALILAITALVRR